MKNNISEMKVQVEKHAKELLLNIREKSYFGWDPFDIQQKHILKWIPDIPISLTLWAKMGEVFPLSLRKIAGCKPMKLAKAVALAARTAITLWKMDKDEKWKAIAKECLNWLRENPSPNRKMHCWGYPFSWKMENFIPENTPNIVVTAQAVWAFLEAYDAWLKEEDFAIAKEAIDFILQELNRQELTDGTICLSYTVLDNFFCHNANLMSAELLTEMGVRTGNHQWVELGLRSARYTTNRQEADGAFDYFGAEQAGGPGVFRVDHFHTGFVLRSLKRIVELTREKEISDALAKGMDFYLKRLCTEEGRPLNWSTKPYPVDIHSCAEAILIPAVLKEYIPNWEERIFKSYKWTCDNLQAPDGTFYALKHKTGWVTKIKYLRWGQAWMAYALAKAGEVLNEKYFKG